MGLVASGYLACYDWRVDRQPATVRSTEGSDVPGCVQVCIDLEATAFAFEGPTITVFLLLKSTFGACARSISWIYGNYLLSDSSRFVFYDASQFCKAPFSKFLILLAVPDVG